MIGSGSNDPQKYDPTATRETLDHSIPYIFTVMLQDGEWDHVASYAPERAQRPNTVELWHKVTTEEDAEWTRRYHSLDISEKAFGGRAEITLTDGTVFTEEIAVADAHPLGARPFGRAEYVGKLRKLADGIIADHELDRFIEATENLRSLGAGELDALNVTANVELKSGKGGIF